MSRNDSKKPLKIENYAQRTTSVKIPYQIPCAGLCIHKCLVFWECPCVSSHTHNTEMIPQLYCVFPLIHNVPQIVY